MQVSLNAAQTIALANLIDNYAGDGEMLITAQDRGSIYVAFTLASFHVDAEGNVEDAE